MNKWRKWGWNSFLFGMFCGLCWLLGQVATNTTFAQLPATSPGGAFNLLSNGYSTAYNVNSHGTRTWFTLGPTFTPPTNAASWTFVTDSGASVSDQANSVILSNTAPANSDIAAILKATPTAPYTIKLTFGMLVADTASGFSCGAIWTNGTTTAAAAQLFRLTEATATSQAYTINVAHVTNFAFAGFTSDYGGSSSVGWSHDHIVLIIQDDTVNRTFSMSDGQNSMVVFSTARGTPFTPTNYGFFCGGTSTVKYISRLLGVN